MDPSRFHDLPRRAVMRSTTDSPALTVIDGFSLPSILYRLSLSATSSITRDSPRAGSGANASPHRRAKLAAPRAWTRVRNVEVIIDLGSGRSGAYPRPWSGHGHAYGVRW